MSRISHAAALHMDAAEASFAKGQLCEAARSARAALRLRRAVEMSSINDHLPYTEVLIRAFVLLLKLGYLKNAFRAYKRAWAWSDDPCCSSIRLNDLAHAEWESREIHERAGRNMRRRLWLRSLFSFLR